MVLARRCQEHSLISYTMCLLHDAVGAYQTIVYIFPRILGSGRSNVIVMALSNGFLNALTLVTSIIGILGLVSHVTTFVVMTFLLTHGSINAELGKVDVLVHSMTEDGSLGSSELFDGNSWKKDWEELHKECDELDGQVDSSRWKILHLLRSCDTISRVLSARVRISRLHRRLRNHSISMTMLQSTSDADVSPCSPQPVWYTPATTPLIEAYSGNNNNNNNGHLTLHRNDSDSDVTVCSETERSTESGECCDSNFLASPLAAGAHEDATGFTILHPNDSEATMCSEAEQNTDLDHGCLSVLSKESEYDSDIDDDEDKPAVETEIAHDTTTFTPRRAPRERPKLVIENLKHDSAKDQACSTPGADAYQNAPDDSNVQILCEKFLAWSGYLIDLFRNPRDERRPAELPWTQSSPV